MNSNKPHTPVDTNEEVAALIETLHQTEQRLEELTAGEVDTVADRDGRTVLLRRAQDYMRYNEAAKQAAILNALPANIALLDTQGIIISVNEAWRRFGRTNALQGPGYEIGVNYLAVCDSAHGENASEAQRAAKGIRSVLDGEVTHYSMEYACHSPAEQRWFLMTVTPLANGHPKGVVVMHLNITERRRAEEALRQSETRYRAMFDQAAVGITQVGLDGTFLKVNPAFCTMLGYSESELVGRHFLDLTHPDDRANTVALKEMLLSSVGQYPKSEFEKRYLRKDGRPMWGHFSTALVRNAEAQPIYFVTMVEDISERKQTEQALKTSKTRFKTMFEQAPLGIALIDSLTGHIHEANPRFAAIAGRSMEAMANIDWLQITHPDDVQADLENMTLMNAGKINGFQMEKRYLHPDGTAIWIDMTVSPLKVEDQTQPRHLCMIQDITERKETENRIVYLNRVYAMLSGINTLIIRAHDRDELFREACRVAVEDGGFRMAMIGIVDRSTMRIVPVATAGKDEEIVADIKSVLSSVELGSTTMVSRAISEKKTIISNDSQNDPQVLFGRKYAECGVRSIAILPLIVSTEAAGVLALYASEIEFFREEELKLLMEMAGDIAFGIDHIDKQERLNYLAYYDVLTGLANRSLFLDRASQYMKSAASGGHKLALILIDLERFKSINDSLGRSAGDALLIQVAEWLKYNAGDANLVARVSADHFAVVLPQATQEGDVARFLEKTMEAFLSNPFHLNDAVFRIAAKIGVAIFPDDGANAETLFMNAEAALKLAKASGERYLFYTQKMTATVASKLTLENQLRQALEKGEFTLHYQPKVNIASGALTSTEALIRWNDPRTGLVPPDQFIPILEETGLINDVGRWALHKAAEDYLRWVNTGLTAVRIAVNVSPLQLRNRGFIDEIRQVIGIDARVAAGLELEITESLIMADVKHSITSLQAIRTLGISIAIDDFGTGFSSLSYLARLPVDTLKIDRSFVIDMTASPEGLALVATIINLAHSLKLNVVAEGVETEEQLRLLRLLDCDEMQGYLFSKPVPSDIFETRFLAPTTGG